MLRWRPDSRWIPQFLSGWEFLPETVPADECRHGGGNGLNRWACSESQHVRSRRPDPWAEFMVAIGKSRKTRTLRANPIDSGRRQNHSRTCPGGGRFFGVPHAISSTSAARTAVNDDWRWRFTARTRAMNALKPPDNFHLDAAKGWLALGNPDEANRELEKITASSNLIHPEVLLVRFDIFARNSRWDECLEIANALTRLVPDEPLAWICFARALHEVKRTRDAWDTLVAIENNFTNEPLIAYNLACYACHLGEWKIARSMLNKAFAMPNAKTLKLRALEEAALKPIWEKPDQRRF